MTTVLIENVDRTTYPNLPPIIHTDSQCTYSYAGRWGRFFNKIGLLQNLEPNHATPKIFKVSGGWVTGAGDYNTILRFVESLLGDIWDKPKWDYHSDIYYVTKLGKVYQVGGIGGDDNISKQDWEWKMLEGTKNRFFYAGSGSQWAGEAYTVQHMKPDAAIRYAAMNDPFTNDIIQCNIDFRSELSRDGRYD